MNETDEDSPRTVVHHASACVMLQARCDGPHAPGTISEETAPCGAAEEEVGWRAVRVRDEVTTSFYTVLLGTCDVTCVRFA